LIENLEKIDSIMNHENLEHSARTVKKFIDEVKNKLKNVYSNLKNFNIMREEIRHTKNEPLSSETLTKINKTCELENSIKSTLDELKGKINMNESIKDKEFFGRHLLIEFLDK
jgi:hypothetical protein